MAGYYTSDYLEPSDPPDTDPALCARSKEIIGDDDRPAVICAWCSAIMSAGSQPTSHGICDSCAQKVFGA
jgi:hypothetical protein